MVIIDSQSVKNTDTAKEKGYDAGKKISGIKRHIAVDTQGLPHAMGITTANVTDRNGAIDILNNYKFKVLPKRWIVERCFSWLEKNRRLWKNCERLISSSLTMMKLVFIRVLIKRF